MARPSCGSDKMNLQESTEPPPSECLGPPRTIRLTPAPSYKAGSPPSAEMFCMLLEQPTPPQLRSLIPTPPRSASASKDPHKWDIRHPFATGPSIGRPPRSPRKLNKRRPVDETADDDSTTISLPDSPLTPPTSTSFMDRIEHDMQQPWTPTSENSNDVLASCVAYGYCLAHVQEPETRTLASQFHRAAYTVQGLSEAEQEQLWIEATEGVPQSYGII